MKKMIFINNDKTKKADSSLGYSLHITLDNGSSIFFGNGVAQLLQITNETKSLKLAAEKMNMAYSKATKIVKEAEEYSGMRFLERKVGGTNGGGSYLTPDGEKFLNAFFAFQKKCYENADGIFREMFKNIG